MGEGLGGLGEVGWVPEAPAATPSVDPPPPVVVVVEIIVVMEHKIFNEKVKKNIANNYQITHTHTHTHTYVRTF